MSTQLPDHYEFRSTNHSTFPEYVAGEPFQTLEYVKKLPIYLLNFGFFSIILNFNNQNTTYREVIDVTNQLDPNYLYNSLSVDISSPYSISEDLMKTIETDLETNQMREFLSKLSDPIDYNLLNKAEFKEDSVKLKLDIKFKKN